MRKIKAEDGKLYEVPVILIISDGITYELSEAVYNSFFEAVERVYGVGWGRKGYQRVYVDEWNTDVYIDSNPFDYVHPVGKEYRQQYDEMVQKAVEKFRADIEANPFTKWSISHQYYPDVANEIHSSVPKSAFPLLYFLGYEPTTQLAEHDVPRDEQWKLMAYMIRQLHHRRTWIDAVFVDAINHLSEDSYDASAIPPVLENLPVTIFNSPEHLTELLIKDKVFLSVKEFTPPTKK
ncbi:MAG: hypothetical protein IJS88_06595 [Alphaproteobacteria bacterium]|nr:hypothetical protein [Alphaproteobacteria bacterium]